MKNIMKEFYSYIALLAISEKRAMLLVKSKGCSMTDALVMVKKESKAGRLITINEIIDAVRSVVPVEFSGYALNALNNMNVTILTNRGTA